MLVVRGLFCLFAHTHHMEVALDCGAVERKAAPLVCFCDGAVPVLCVLKGEKEWSVKSESSCGLQI